MAAEQPQDGDGEGHHHHGGEGTTHESYRWKWLSSLLAGIVGVSYPALLVLHVLVPGYSVGSIPQAWFVAYTTGWLAVLAYTFGADTIKAVQDAWEP